MLNFEVATQEASLGQAKIRTPAKISLTLEPEAGNIGTRKGRKKPRKMVKMNRKKKFKKSKKRTLKRNNAKSKSVKRKPRKRQEGKKKKCKKGACRGKGKKRKGVQKSCSPLSCLNDMVFALKIEKNTVKNFLAQERRLNAKINLMSKFSSFNHLI